MSSGKARLKNVTAKQWVLFSTILIVCAIVLIIAASIFRSTDNETNLNILRVGILPDDDDEIIRRRYAPLLSYLSEATGIDTQLVLPSNYGKLVSLFNDQKIDLAYFGGLTFLQSYSVDIAEPLVMRDIDLRFTSFFFSKGTDSTADIYEFEGRKMSFGSHLSTSGHLMPRQYLQSIYQINPESFFSEITYSGAHDTTVYNVRDGITDVGVANSEIIVRMINDGRLQPGEINIFWETPPYSDYVWAVNRNLPTSIKSNLRDGFLTLSKVDKVHQIILTNLGANNFVPAGIGDFSPLQEVAKKLDMIVLNKK